MASMIWMILTPVNPPIYWTTVEHDRGRATRLRSVPTSGRVNKSLLWARAEDQPQFPTKLQFLLRLLETEKKLLPSLSVSSSPATT